MIIKPYGLFGGRYVLDRPGLQWWRLSWVLIPVMIVAAVVPILLLGLQPVAYAASLVIAATGYGAVHACFGRAMRHARPVGGLA